MERREGGDGEGERREEERREGVEVQKEKLTKGLVHHGLLFLFLTLFIHQWAEGIPEDNQSINQSITDHPPPPVKQAESRRVTCSISL